MAYSIKAAFFAAGMMAAATSVNAATITPGPLAVDGTSYDSNPFNGVSGGSALISFNLLGYNTLDGTNSYQDDFVLSLNGTDIYRASFGLGGGGGDLIIFNPMGLVFSGVTTTAVTGAGGTLTISGLISGLISGANTLGFRYLPVGPDNGGGQSVADEGWGVNNVSVSAVPLPPAAILLVSGLVGIAGLNRRRKNKAA